MFARWKIALVTSVMVFLIVCVFGISFVFAMQTKSISIVDSAGRLIKIPQPLNRVVVLNPPVAEVMRALGITDKICGISGTLARVDYWPKLSKLPKVSRYAHGEPDYEKIIELKPQVVITYGTHPAIDTQKIADALKPAGIEVVGIDCYKLDTLFKDIATLGIMFNEEAKAAKLIIFFQDVLDDVEKKVTNLKAKEKPRVYFESAMGDYISFGRSSSYNKMIKMAGGTNIFADMPMPYPEVDPEAVVKRNPQVIIKFVLGMRVPIGYGATEVMPIKTYVDQLTSRTGWKAIDAVRNKRVYVIAMDLMSGPTKVIAIPYIARILHPEVDFDPQTILREYLEKWQGVKLKGIFVYPKP